jgi:hypothetical protein
MHEFLRSKNSKAGNYMDVVAGAAGPPGMAAVTNFFGFCSAKPQSPKMAGRHFWAAQGIEAEQKTQREQSVWSANSNPGNKGVFCWSGKPGPAPEGAGCAQKKKMKLSVPLPGMTGG